MIGPQFLELLVDASHGGGCFKQAIGNSDLASTGRLDCCKRIQSYLKEIICNLFSNYEFLLMVTIVNIEASQITVLVQMENRGRIGTT